jgi:hypothetical protein
MIFKGVQNIPALKDGAHLDATVGVSPKGWITSELFQKWLEQFIKSLPPARPVLLLVDSHVSHLSPEALQTAEENLDNNSNISVTYDSCAPASRC